MKPKTGFFAALALIVFGSSVHAEAPQNKFLQLSAEQRYWYFYGAMTTTAHLISMQDKAKGECAAKWYLNDKDGKQKLIEATLAKYPAEGPTTIILSLLGQACGSLTFK